MGIGKLPTRFACLVLSVCCCVGRYVVGRDGKPSATRFGDEDLADKLTPVIDELLKANKKPLRVVAKN